MFLVLQAQVVMTACSNVVDQRSMAVCVEYCQCKLDTNPSVNKVGVIKVDRLGGDRRPMRLSAR